MLSARGMKTKKDPSGPSITEAICDVLEFGSPRNSQVAEIHRADMGSAKRSASELFHRPRREIALFATRSV
jgi:hypothetical protein